MKIENFLGRYYEEEISRVEIPPCPDLNTGTIYSRTENNHPLFRFAFAALIALAFIPLIYNSTRPSTLAIRANEVCSNVELNSRISAGLINLHKIVSNSLISGGKK